MKTRKFLLVLLAITAIGAVSGPVINQLRDLQDVRLPAAASITDGNSLVWVASLSKWTNGAPVGAGFPSGGNVNDVMVNIASGTGAWSNALSVATLNAGTLNLTNQIGKHLISTNGGVVNHVLTFNGTIWTNAAPSSGVTTNYDGLQITNSVHFMNTGSSNANSIYGPVGVTNGLNFENNSVNIALGGTNFFQFTNSSLIIRGATSSTKLLLASAEDFDATPTGIYRNAADRWDFQANGVNQFYMDSQGLNIAGQLKWSNTILTQEGSAILQMGTDNNPPIDQTFKGPDGSGANFAGGNLTIGPGRPSGTGTVARVKIAVGTNSTSASSTAQNYGTAVVPGGTLKVDTTTTGNVGAGEDTLISYTIPGGELSVNGDSIEFRVWGSCAANTNTKDIKVYFGSTVVSDGGVVVLNGVSWSAHGVVIRTGATTQTATCELTAGAAVLAQSTTSSPAETLSGNVVFKVTGTSAVAPADNDIVQNGMVIRWLPGQ